MDNLTQLARVAKRMDLLAEERERLIDAATAEGHSELKVSLAAGWGRTTLHMRRKRGVRRRVREQI